MLVELVFMLAGYQGEAPVLTRLPFFAGLGLFGVIYGALLGLGEAWLRRLIRLILPA